MRILPSMNNVYFYKYKVIDRWKIISLKTSEKCSWKRRYSGKLLALSKPTWAHISFIDYLYPISISSAVQCLACLAFAKKDEKNEAVLSCFGTVWNSLKHFGILWNTQSYKRVDGMGWDGTVIPEQPAYKSHRRAVLIMLCIIHGNVFPLTF